MFFKKLKLIGFIPYDRQLKQGYYDSTYDDDDTQLFEINFTICDGNCGRYIGTTKDIRMAIDNHCWDMRTYHNQYIGYKKEWELRHIAENISILKYGYFWEHQEIYQETEYTIDNAFWISVKKYNKKKKEEL